MGKWFSGAFMEVFERWVDVALMEAGLVVDLAALV